MTAPTQDKDVGGGDSPKPHGDKLEHARQAAAGNPAGETQGSGSSRGDSPKPHGDKLEHARQAAAGKPEAK